MLVMDPALSSWTQHVGKNCYTGHGAIDLEHPEGSSCGTMSLAACQAKCDGLAGCSAITVAAGQGSDVTCFRRSNIVLSQCAEQGGFSTWVKDDTPPTPAPAPTPPLPGVADVCANLSAAERCSPEICSAQPHTRVKLEARTYYHDRSIMLPPGAALIGAGVNRTFVIACGEPSAGRRGFILNNDTYLGHLTWQGLQASRGNFDAAVGSPGCLSSTCSGGCIPAGGDCAGIANATVEHIHVRPYQSADGRAMWPLSSSAGWFPKTLPWGPQRRTGSANITLRGVISWGTWADGINFHGGHHNVLIEQCQMSFTGDDPFGLWPSSADAAADAAQCQQNIILRNNTARWPRQYSGSKAGSGGRAPRDYPDCDCSDAPPHSGCYSHTCFATYAGGLGIAFLGNHCEGARALVAFNGDFPDPSKTKWCGVLAVAGNTYAAATGQGSGCRASNSTDPPCVGRSDAPSLGGQCSPGEALLPAACGPPAPSSRLLTACRATPGVGGACYNDSGPALCLTAAQLAQGAAQGDLCGGYAHACTL